MVCDAKGKTLSASALTGSPHELFWKLFHSRVLQLSNDAINVSTETLANRQLVSSKLSELANNLGFKSSPMGRWLSTMRNAVNYAQKHATWYPYSGQEKYYERLFEKVFEWNEDPIDLELRSWGEQDLRRFQVTCNFIIAAFRSIAIDMAGRCTSGRSFHNFGALACLAHANRPQVKRSAK